ncbi:Importin subunit alpha [Seminavis robusta]|uniref:Importin subunit alpha n=1 Tax=Seminavis robusta TaxID=568900 RepID=A0A9N8DZZ0_9STRA|nr:Importin subunit alpha [Seminavis robusta]|eukprot:Sro513_g157860.1 Importin subunit alpha (891) ;mRNA; r:35293-38367
MMEQDTSAITDITDGAKRLAQELDQYIAAGPNRSAVTGDTAATSSTSAAANNATLSNDAIADLQLATARKLRELLPNNRDLLLLAQERNWIPLLLSWLNLHDRPAVQVEALLALTNIAELCAQQSYLQAQTSAVASATQAAAAAAKTTPPAPLSAPLYSFGNTTTNSSSNAKTNNNNSSTSTTTTSTTPAATYPYPSLVAPAPGSVPFPPLSFSQTLSPEAVAAFDASLVSTIQSGTDVANTSSTSTNSATSTNSSKKDTTKTGVVAPAHFSMPPAPLFPTSSLPGSFQPPNLAQHSGGINFTSLAPPPSGAHNSVPSNAFLPPPTPISTKQGTLSFPQQLSASSQHLLLRHADAIPTLISLLSSPNREVYEQAMWILGSIAAGDSPGTSSTSGSNSTSNNSLEREKSVSARDVILAAGVMNQLLSLLPVLRRLLRTADAEVLSYTCWTLSHLCDGPSSHIAAVVTSEDPKDPKCGLVPRLVELLTHPSWRVTKPALRTIGNIVCAECSDDNNNNHGSSSASSAATTDYTEVILECGAVPRLMELITHSNREIQKESCWTLSNIAAGTVDQIQAVIDSGAIPPLVKLVRDKKTDQEVRSEACWVVLNATSCGSDSQIEILVDEGCVAVLGVLLSEASMVMMALEGLERVLQVEETREMIRREQIESREIRDTDGKRPPNLVSASLIEQARENHNSSAVTKRADRIWKQHFVSCALCKQSFSKHRTSDASFCEECKCYVCSGCNCQIYHLSYQEELWAANEEKTEKKKEAKKSKNKKKKEKLKQKKAKQQQPTNTPEEECELDKEPTKEGVQSTIISPTSVSSRDERMNAPPPKNQMAPGEKQPGPEFEAESNEPEQTSVDLVLYLQQTGSIIALAKLIDMLDYGEEESGA